MNILLILSSIAMLSLFCGLCNIDENGEINPIFDIMLGITMLLLFTISIVSGVMI